MTESSLGDFFSRNSQLFTVLGVFGAISVYFTRLEVESRWQRLGTVSSLTIFILVALAIQQNLSPPSSDKEPFDFVVNQQLHRKGHVIFYVAFYAVVISVVGIVLRFSNTFVFLLQFFLTIGGVGLTRWWVTSLDVLDDYTPTVGEDEELVLYSLYLLRRGSYPFILGTGILTLVWLQGMVPLQDLLRFQINSLASALLIGLSSGIIVGGVLYSLLGILAICLHFMLKILARRDSLEDVGEMYQNVWGSKSEDSGK